MTEQQIIQSKMVMESPDTFMLRGAIEWSGLIFHHVCVSGSSGVVKEEKCTKVIFFATAFEGKVQKLLRKMFGNL